MRSRLFPSFCQICVGFHIISYWFDNQVEPQYLARLILEMPQQQSTKFIESVILTLYNYASNPRDEYLLLKLFSTSLRQEIMQSIENMTDIVTGTPLAIKMVVDFHRWVICLSTGAVNVYI